MHAFTQSVCEDKSRRTTAKSDFPFIDNSHLEQCQNKRITMGKPDGLIEIEVGETFFDVLKALLARPFDWISAASREVLTLLESALQHFEVLKFLWQQRTTSQDQSSKKHTG